mmetsp:Transcript_8498/g.18066  ORF Transcript_8498/g.18066 Transcript_8498/m.18066 type:complete len:201 (+) Transcript_8498:737-1339(+)
MLAAPRCPGPCVGHGIEAMAVPTLTAPIPSPMPIASEQKARRVGDHRRTCLIGTRMPREVRVWGECSGFRGPSGPRSRSRWPMRRQPQTSALCVTPGLTMLWTMTPGCSGSCPSSRASRPRISRPPGSRQRSRLRPACTPTCPSARSPLSCAMITSSYRRSGTSRLSSLRWRKIGTSTSTTSSPFFRAATSDCERWASLR